MTGEVFLQVGLTGFTMSVVYVLMALGLTLIFSILHILNFAHGEVYMLGGFGIYYFLSVLGLNYFLSLALTMALLAVLGMMIERGMFRLIPGRILEGFILSFGLALTLQAACLLIFGVEDKGVGRIVTGVLDIGVFHSVVHISYQKLLTIPLALACLAGLWLFIKKTKMGQGLLAVAQDRDAAALQGIGYGRSCSVAFALGFALAGGAGGLMAPLIFINPYIGGLPVLKAFVIIILGGLGSIPGCVIGAFILGYLDAFGGALWGGPVAAMIGFALFILVIVIRPSGIMGGFYGRT